MRLMLPLAIGFFGMFALDYFTPIESRVTRFVILVGIIMAVYLVLYLRRSRKRR